MVVRILLLTKFNGGGVNIQIFYIPLLTNFEAMLIKLILFLLAVLVVVFISIVIKYNKEASRQRRGDDHSRRKM